MESGLISLSKQIEVAATTTKETLQKKEKVDPKKLQQLIIGIKSLNKYSTGVTQVDRSSIDSNLKAAIESIYAVEQMIENMMEEETNALSKSIIAVEKMISKIKEEETDVITKSIKRGTDVELEGNARVDIINQQLPFQYFQDMVKDLKKFLKTGTKIEKVYKPKTS